MSVIAWVLLIFGLIAAFFAWQIALASRQTRETQQKHDALRSSYAGWDIHISAWGDVLGVSPTLDRFVIGTVDAPRDYLASELAQVDVVRDGGTVTTSDRGSQIAGAAIGGALFGEIGALVGGVSGSQRTSQTVFKLALKIVINDPAAPVREIPFFQLGRNLTADWRSPALQSTMANMNKYHALLLLVLRRSGNPPAAPVGG